MEILLIILIVKLFDPITFVIVFIVSFFSRKKLIIPIAAATGAIAGEVMLSASKASYSWGQQLIPALFACSIQAYICYKIIGRFKNKATIKPKSSNHKQVKSKAFTSNELMANNYATWDNWYKEFVVTSGQVNSQLEPDEEGRSLIDLMDHEPLSRAYKDGVNPKKLALDFANKFDITSFGK